MSKIFIDCGAHCGESILEAKSRYGNDIKIISFEANPNLAQVYIKKKNQEGSQIIFLWIFLALILPLLLKT